LLTAATRRDGWPTAGLWAALVEAELADDSATWRRAVDAAVSAEGPVHVAVYARYRLGAALLAEGDRAGATSALRVAAEVADRLGAGLLRQAVADLARRGRVALVEPVPGGAERPPAPRNLGLTPRELEVLRLVAAGRSNRLIGEQLFISTKTASVHVSNILAKLGVTGRGEAAALAHRERLFDAERLHA
jgi:DNA-binding CsgD family transcriptional regulator